MNLGKVAIGGLITFVGLAEPTPIMEIVGLAIMANGLGVKLPKVIS